MGIDVLGDIKKWFKKVENLGKDSIRKIENIGKDAIKKIENFGKDAIKKIENEGNSVVNKVKNEGSGIINTIEKEGSGVINTIEKEGQKALNVVEEEIEKIPDTIEVALELAIDELSKAITKEGLKKAQTIVRTVKNRMDKFAEGEYDEELNKITFGLDLGPFNLSYDSFYDRSSDLVTTLDSFISKPPAFRRSDIKRLITALAPSSVGVSGSINVAFLVVNTDELGVGVSVSGFTGKLVALIVDDILKALNVPE